MIHTATAIRSGAAFRPRLRILGRALLVLLGTLGALAPGATQSAPPKTPAKARSPKKPTATEKTRAFLEKRGPQLWQGKLPFNNVGANIPDLFERFLLGQ